MRDFFIVVLHSGEDMKLLSSTLLSIAQQTGSNFGEVKVVVRSTDIDSKASIFSLVDNLNTVSIRAQFQSKVMLDDGPSQALNAEFAGALTSGEDTSLLLSWLGTGDFLLPWALDCASYASGLVKEAGAVTSKPTMMTLDNLPVLQNLSDPVQHLRSLGKGVQGKHFFQEGTFFSWRAFTQIGGIDQTLKAAFDYDFFLRMYQEFSFLHVDMPLAVFSQSTGQLSSSQGQRMELEKFAAANKIAFSQNRENPVFLLGVDAESLRLQIF